MYSFKLTSHHLNLVAEIAFSGKLACLWARTRVYAPVSIPNGISNYLKNKTIKSVKQIFTTFTFFTWPLLLIVVMDEAYDSTVTHELHVGY